MLTASATRDSGFSASLALYATSAFIILSGLIFLSPFALSANAQQNDVYMGNLFIGVPVFLIGCVLFIASLTGLGLHTRLAVLLGLGNLLVAAALTLGFADLPISLAPYLAGINVILLFVVSWAVARGSDRLAIWGRGLLLALIGSSIMALSYALFGGRYYSAGGSAVTWPPYLTLPILGLAAVVAAATFLIGWLWGRARAH